MNEPTIEQLQWTIAKQKKAIDGLTSSILVYLRDLRNAADDLSRTVYLGRSERELLNATIKALEKSLADDEKRQ